MTEIEKNLEIMGFMRMIEERLEYLRLNEYRIVMLIAEHLHRLPESNHDIELEIPFAEIIQIIEIYQTPQKSVEVDPFEMAWGELLELKKKNYPCATLNQYLCLSWMETPSLNLETKTIKFKIYKDMVQVYRLLWKSACLPYAFVLSRNATRLLSKIKTEAQQSKKWGCPTCLIKTSLFKQKSPDWRTETLEPAMQEIMRYTAYDLKQFEPTQRTVVLGCKLDEDTIHGKINVLEKEKQLYDCLPAELLNQHFPYHELNMKMLEEMKKLSK